MPAGHGALPNGCGSVSCCMCRDRRVSRARKQAVPGLYPQPQRENQLISWRRVDAGLRNDVERIGLSQARPYSTGFNDDLPGLDGDAQQMPRKLLIGLTGVPFTSH